MQPGIRGRLILSLVFLAVAAWPAAARGDAFDRYTNSILASAPRGEGVKEIPRLTAELASDHSKLLPPTGSALLMVRTNGNRNCKVAVQLARQRTAKGSVPIALIERFVTFKDGEEQAFHARGQSINLYNGFLLNLDLGQIVPEDLGGDLRFVVKDGDGYLEPVGSAKLYLLTKHLPGTEPKKLARPAIGETFEPRFFTGTYRMFDDGRRFAKLTLKVAEDGQVTGEYVSEKTGSTYEVHGKVANPRHFIQFTVKFPNTEQSFQGWMFTQDGLAISGSTRLQEREFGWYAQRLDRD